MYGIRHYLFIFALLLLPLTAFASGEHLIGIARDYAPCVMAGAALALRVRFFKIHSRR